MCYGNLLDTIKLRDKVSTCKHTSYKHFQFLFLGLAAIVLAGCAGNADIKNSTENMSQWVEKKTIKDTFISYKDYLERNYSGGDVLWAEGLRVKGFFYVDEAELSVGISGNPFITGPFLHVQMLGSGSETSVTTRASNQNWVDVAQKLKSLD